MISIALTSQPAIKFRLLLPLALVFVPMALARAQVSPEKTAGQLGKPITWIGVPDSKDLFYMAQQTKDGKLYLTPNEAFFPKLGLTAVGDGEVADVENLNGGKSFATIEGWDDSDVAEWGLLLNEPGDIHARVWMTAKSNEGRFTLRLGDSDFSFSTKQASGQPILMAETRFRIHEPGQLSMELICNQAGTGTALHWIEVSGEACDRGSVLRKRWRPAAAHTKFSSSQSPDNVRLWVMEMDAKPGSLSFYSPMTTPFGYYGPTWQADGTVNSSFNFSLWSFGRGQPEPPIEQLSHLLAIGDPEAKFGGFGHEGTGVKIREWEPLAGRQGQRQTLALRVEPGKLYNTFYSYFYAKDEKRWRLFGIGNKIANRKPLSSLTLGSFVEVPGPPHVQRTGPYPRVMRYRGWIMDAQGAWYRLDRMTNGNVSRDTGLTHTDRGVNDDGWFYLQTGGWMFRKPRPGDYVELDPPPTPPNVDYLNQDDIAYLNTTPSEITWTGFQRTGNRIRGEFTVRNAANSPLVQLHWGTQEALTFADRWRHQVTLDEPHEGRNTFEIDNVPSGGTVFLRLLLKNNQGQFWTPTTLRIDPE